MDLNIDEAFDFIKKSLNELPDSSGILRCVLFADLLRVVSSLQESVDQKTKAQKEEILILQAQIRDLEDEIATLKAGREEQ